MKQKPSEIIVKFEPEENFEEEFANFVFEILNSKKAKNKPTKKCQKEIIKREYLRNGKQAKED